jgi:hypothetical protein
MADAEPGAVGAAAAAATPDADPHALVAALCSADADAQQHAVAALVPLVAGKWDTADNPDACAALLDAGMVDAILAPLRAGLCDSGSGSGGGGGVGALSLLELLNAFTSVYKPARTAVHAAGGLELMMQMLEAGAPAAAAAQVLRLCTHDAAVSAAFGGDASVSARLLSLLRKLQDDDTALSHMLYTLGYMSQSCEPARLSWLRSGCIPLLNDVMRRDGTTQVCCVNVAQAVYLLSKNNPVAPVAAPVVAPVAHQFGFGFVAFGGPPQLQPPPQPLVAAVTHGMALFDAGIFAAVVARLCVEMAHPVPASTHALHFARLFARSYANEPRLRPRLAYLLLSQPGALAGVSFAAFASANAADIADFLGSFHDALAEHWLLDSHLAAHYVLNLGCAAHCPVALRLKAAWEEPAILSALAQPLRHQRLPAAVSLALMSDSEAVREKLLSGTHLETLAAALVGSTAETPATSCAAELQQDIVRGALRRFFALTDPAPAAPAAKRLRTDEGGATLRAEDVNVQRRDSTVLLITGRPFYVNGALVELRSPVLAQALREATTLDPFPLTLSVDAPEADHYELFRAAVEFIYTGDVANIQPQALLPLWCLGHQLEIAALRAWCCARLQPLLTSQPDVLEAVWAVALQRPTHDNALLDACATGWLRAEMVAEDGAMVALLARVREGRPLADVLTPLVRALRAQLQPAAATDGAGGARQARLGNLEF